MKSDVGQGERFETWKNNFERLDRAIKILIVDGVLIVPDTGSGAGDFVTDEYDSVVSRIGLDLVYCRACPGVNSRVHSRRRSQGRKGEIGRAANTELAVGGVVILVALPGMRLAPVVFMWSDILCFGKIDRPLIEGCVQITGFNKNAVRYAVVGVAVVIVSSRLKDARKRIDPCTRTDLVLIAI
jgi:hypothetical protein